MARGRNMAEFSMDDAQSDAFNGYVTGVATSVQAPKYIDSAVDFAYDHLSNRFEDMVDNVARLNKEHWHHVYEWGDTYGDKSTVGIEKFRLWRLVPVDTGTGKAVGFTFLPSIRPVPLHPKEIQAGVTEGKHVFTWKAPVMEYGQTVIIEPVEALKGKLVFYWEKIGKVVATTKTITTQLDPNVVGTFTNFFIAWWGTEARNIFNNEVRPVLEKNIVPRDRLGRFVKRTKAQSQFGSKQSVNISNMNFSRGMREAERDMQRIAAGYKQGRGGFRNYRGN